MSDDDDELAELRAQRAARTGQISLSSLRHKLDHARGAGPDDTTASVDKDGPEADDMNTVSLNGSNGHPASVAEDPGDDAGIGPPIPQDLGDAMVGCALPPEEADGLDGDAWKGQRFWKASIGSESAADRMQDVGDDAGIGPPIPQDLGDDMVGPAVPPEEADGMEGDAWDGRGLGEPDVQEDPYRLPVTSEVALEGQGKYVASLDIDHSGSRVLSGSRDYSVRLFDFNGMKSDLKSFRQIQPFDGHPVHAVSWSPSGDQFLAVTGAAKIKVFNRDGTERGESLQGDMYIRDQRNTKGHVSPCTYGHWHPTDRYTALTSSEDGTVRVWDTHNVVQKTVVKPTLAKPGRVTVSMARYNNDGHLIVAGLNNGTLQSWDVRGKFGASAAIGQVMPPTAQMVAKQDWRYVSGGGQVLHGAHAKDCEVTSLAFSKDGNTFLSRAADDTLKVWDLRKFKTPVHVWEDLPAMHPTTQVVFSPDERLILTGVSAGRDGTGGALVFFDAQSRSLVRRIGMPSSVVAVQWHAKLNQIMVGVGDKKAGSVRILYDTTWSTRGVLQAVGRKPRSRNPFDFQAPLVIHNPHALPMYREDRPHGKRKREKDRMDPVKSHAPERGSAAQLKPGTGGNIGVTGGTLLTQYILKNQGMLRNPAEEDIRASILRHADKEGDQFSTFTKAYAKTQPERIFQEEEKDEEGSDKEA